jgi:ribosomal protein S27AE
MLRLRKEGYKVAKSKFPNKKRTCFNCGSTEHFVANCPHEKHDNNKKDKKESKYENKKERRHDHKNGKRQMGEAHIGHEWDSTKESSSDEDDKIATIAIHTSSSPPRLFNNMPNDDDHYSPTFVSWQRVGR